ncbi:hypothetical protein ABEB36_009611 [Hypothenemus hampei]|uniref:Uncharacterized protein n=1 Tax=Hypothenemus hampei TaxID=57062 RepID=A0ABD1EH38_HYPHA
MGNTQAKQEEIIIAQAGNSGGQTKAKEFGSAPDILAMVTLLFLMTKQSARRYTRAGTRCKFSKELHGPTPGEKMAPTLLSHDTPSPSVCYTFPMDTKGFDAVPPNG